MQAIHTLDARGHIMLECMRDHFGIAVPQMRREILELHDEVIGILSLKGINYSDLRSGLVPNADKHEAAFIFDSTKIESCAYGSEVMARVLPLLDPRTTHSVLVGDLLGENDEQETIFHILHESIILARTFISSLRGLHQQSHRCSSCQASRMPFQLQRLSWLYTHIFCEPRKNLFIHVHGRPISQEGQQNYSCT